MDLLRRYRGSSEGDEIVLKKSETVFVVGERRSARPACFRAGVGEGAVAGVLKRVKAETEVGSVLRAASALTLVERATFHARHGERGPTSSPR